MEPPASPSSDEYSWILPFFSMRAAYMLYVARLVPLFCVFDCMHYCHGYFTRTRHVGYVGDEAITFIGNRLSYLDAITIISVDVPVQRLMPGATCITSPTMTTSPLPTSLHFLPCASLKKMCCTFLLSSDHYGGSLTRNENFRFRKMPGIFENIFLTLHEYSHNRSGGSVRSTTSKTLTSIIKVPWASIGPLSFCFIEMMDNEF